MWCFGKSSLDFMRPYLFIRTLNWVILDLEGVESIHIILEAMGGHGTIYKFIFLALFMLSLLQNVPRAIR